MDHVRETNAREPSKTLPGRDGFVFRRRDVLRLVRAAPLRPEHERVQATRLYVTYNRASAGDHRERYFADKHKNLPPDIEREPGKVYEFKV